MTLRERATSALERAAAEVHKAVTAREVLSAAGLALVWFGVRSAYSPGSANIVAGALLLYAGLWHALIVALALGASRRTK